MKAANEEKEDIAGMKHVPLGHTSIKVSIDKVKYSNWHSIKKGHYHQGWLLQGKFHLS